MSNDPRTDNQNASTHRYLISHGDPLVLARLSQHLVNSDTVDALQILGNPDRPDALAVSMSPSAAAQLQADFVGLIVEKDSELSY